MDDMSTDILTLVDEDGVEHEFEIADTLDLDDERYMALIPVFDDEADMLDDSGELVVLKVVAEDGDEFLEAIQDEEEFNKVSKIFMDKLDEMYDFIDQDGENNKN